MIENKLEDRLIPSRVSLKGVISEFVKAEKKIEDGIDFHKKVTEILFKLGSLELVSNVFERNLAEEIFLNKKWTSYEIPQLIIFEDERITLKYHFFLPVKSLSRENAAYLIHHHGNNILSSLVFFGSGYESIEFKKNILKLNDQSFGLKIERDFFHTNGSINLLEGWTPHIISNVSQPTATVTLWSSGKTKKDEGERLNYIFENGKYYGMTDSTFLSSIMKSPSYESDSHQHIQAICYFMQKIGYQNEEFISDVVSKIDQKSYWLKWLIKLKNNELIEHPYLNEAQSTLGKEISINEIRRSSIM